jgi:DNA helicase II / ATP-dependent DNA helicase PcrA
LRREGVEADLAALSEATRWLATLANCGDEALLREQVALSTEADFWDPRADRVSLLTMHAAKGLEFPVVFAIGMEAGLTPFSWGEGQENDTEAEERRLFYVAMTRAKDCLFLSCATQRSWRGQLRALPPSPFLRDIPPGLTQRIAPSAKRRAEPRQYSLF